MKYTLSILSIALVAIQLYGQDSSLVNSNQELDAVIVTATRKEKKVSDVALPIVLIGKKQIQLSGLTHLNELLEEQSGMVISQDHGSGIQIQGFDPEYTMVLIDNEPVLGRVAGTLDLKRISLRNVERIEILKGASSCLFGSNAMAGVINIITKRPSLDTEVNLFTKFQTPKLFENSISASKGYGQHGFTLFYSRIDNDGFKLDKSQSAKTIPASTENHANVKWYGEWGAWSISPTIRWVQIASPKQNVHTEDGIYDSESTVNDGSLGLSTRYKYNQRFVQKLNLYRSFYDAKDAVWDAKSDARVGNDFQQDYTKLEFVSEYDANEKHNLVFGVGGSQEQISTVRYASTPKFTTQFAFVQDEWFINPTSTLTIGARFDNHNVYGNQLSPKASVIKTVSEKWKVKASVGTGFKTPDLRQLYLDYSNPIVGYNVFGVKVADQKLKELMAQNQISRVIRETSENLEAERSVSFNAAGIWQWRKDKQIEINVFYNKVSELINSVAIAQKTNGQLVYSYENISGFVTKGLAIDSKNRLSKNIKLNLGGQFLIATDKAQKQQVENGEIFVRNPETLETRPVRYSEYLGLFGRSKFNATASVQYTYSKIKTEFFLRYNWRSAYALFDSNGNNVYDAFDERSGNFHQVNFTASKTIKSITMQAAVYNVLNNRNVQFIPTNPGIQYMLSASYSFKKKPNQIQFQHP